MCPVRRGSRHELGQAAGSALELQALREQVVEIVGKLHQNLGMVQGPAYLMRTIAVD